MLVTQYLLVKKYITKDQLKKAKKISEKDRRIAALVLLELKFITMEQLLEAIKTCCCSN